MRDLPLLLLLLLCTCAHAQTTRIDTVAGPQEGMLTYRYFTEMPAGTKMSKAERFMRGLKPDGPTPAWDQLDSIVIVNAASGKRLAEEKLSELFREEGGSGVARAAQRRKVPAADIPVEMVYTETDLVVLEGRIGEPFNHEVTVHNASSVDRLLQRVDNSTVLETNTHQLGAPPKSRSELQVVGALPAGSETFPLVFAQGDSLRLEVRFSLNGHDLSEGDFVASRAPASLPVWTVPDDRETLYLRLRSTEKLMTAYQGGEVYRKIAVGRQLDELSLIGLAPGTYLLEVIDLRSGQKRYHGLRRVLRGR